MLEVQDTPSAIPLGAATADILLRLLTEAAASVDADRFNAKSCLDRARALLENERSPRRPCPGAAQQALAPWQVKRVSDYVEENLSSPIRIVDLARVTRLTPGYFSRAFKGSFGVPPHLYLVNRRMELAQHLMLTTDDPLSQIALACGLSDQAHFSRMFGRVHGVSPGAWRRDRRGSVHLV